MAGARAGEHAVRRVRDLIRADLLAGRHARRLPDEFVLVTRYECSRGVLRSALALLVDEGLLERTRGTGTFMLTRKVLARLDEAHGQAPHDPSSLWAGGMSVRVLERGMRPLPAAAAVPLDAAAGEHCLLVDYVALVDGEPAAVATNYVVGTAAQALADVPLRTDWYAFLGAGGVQLGRSEFLIEAGLADMTDVRVLGVSPGDPLIIMQQLIRDEAGRAFDLAFIRLAGGRWAFYSSLPRLAGGTSADGPDAPRPEGPTGEGQTDASVITSTGAGGGSVTSAAPSKAAPSW